MTTLKSIIKKILWKSSSYQKFKYKKIYQTRKKRLSFLAPDERSALHYIAVYCNNKGLQIANTFPNINITIRPGRRFQTWIDTGIEFVNKNRMVDNTSPHYGVIIDNSIESLITLYDESIKTESNKQVILVLKSVKEYILRICDKIEDLIEQNPQDFYLRNTHKHFQKMLTDRAETLEDALQRILFWSSIFWQCNQRLIGIGRLDKLLNRFVNEVDEVGDLKVKEIIKDFLTEMHRYYAFKSNPVAMGDTGQIIILGGIEPGGKYFCNAFTYLFIDAIKELHLPDPKSLLRVSDKMPEDLLQRAIDSIASGIGCPLLSNDDIVIPALMEFGYEQTDACNYVTSACWEPLAYGMSLEVNNIFDLNYAEVLCDICRDSSLLSCHSFDEVITLYCERLGKYVDEILSQLAEIRWEMNPLMSLFVVSCREVGKDVSQGGAKYNNYGILTVGLSNTVNSLMNLRELVFGTKEYTISDFVAAQKSNFSGFEELKKKLSNSGYFGKDDELVISLINKITETVYRRGSSFRNQFGGKLKWGLSSSGYAEKGKNTEATLDGREAKQPLGVHISNNKSEPFTELVLFASKLNYSGNRSNGNVLDFFVAPQLINNNFDKFLLFIRSAIKIGFYQMQMNVVSSEVLRDALLHPENHVDLIVRVWGFSAYFNELPRRYQELLIQRAEESEKIA